MESLNKTQKGLDSNAILDLMKGVKVDQVEKLGLRLGLQHNLIDQFKKDTGDTELLACKLIQCWQENFEGSGDAERQKLDEALRKCNMRSRTYASELLTDEDREPAFYPKQNKSPRRSSYRHLVHTAVRELGTPTVYEITKYVERKYEVGKGFDVRIAKEISTAVSEGTLVKKGPYRYKVGRRDSKTKFKDVTGRSDQTPSKNSACDKSVACTPVVNFHIYHITPSTSSSSDSSSSSVNRDALRDVTNKAQLPKPPAARNISFE